MELVVLIIHLLVCVCLIGLVLLQRSEGGALGMGGGGGGSLMSGRGAADALARMTSVAGGFFLVTSLGLTVLSGAAASTSGSSNVFDNILPARESSVAPAPVTPAPVDPDAARPDPTESSAPQSANTQLAAILPGPAPATAAPASTTASTRAAPLSTATNPPTGARGATTVPTSATTRATPTPTTTRTPPPATTSQQRSGGGTTQATAANAGQPIVIPNTSGAVTGISLSESAQPGAESIEIEGGGVEAVRRERAGPDQ